ncbi:MAG: hypothetical protein RBR30_02790 [Tenuifilaceae bacterium]|nr:hypothetical protein [Tenuifilaceae bacterium]
MNEFELQELTHEEAISTNGGSIFSSIVLGFIIGGGAAIVVQFVHDLIHSDD